MVTILDVLLIDDNRAKKYAILNDVRVIGSLGFLIKPKVYISNKLIYQALEICCELEE